MLSLKLHNNGEIRRFQLDSATPFAAFQQYLERFYFVSVPINYKDSDGDLILLSNDNDWEECKRLHSVPPSTIHLFVGTNLDIPVKKARTAESAPSSAPSSASQSSASQSSQSSASQASPSFASLFGGAPGLPPGLPIEQLLNLARTPQGEALLSNFGLNSASAAGLLNHLQSAHNNNNEAKAAAPSEVAICDECDAPIQSDQIRFHCVDCPDFDLHEKCKTSCMTHDASHRFETQFARNSDIERLCELANVPRELATEMLNHSRGEFNAALEKLLVVQQ